jgi:hypothetical protein
LFLQQAGRLSDAGTLVPAARTWGFCTVGGRFHPLISATDPMTEISEAKNKNVKIRFMV